MLKKKKINAELQVEQQSAIPKAKQGNRAKRGRIKTIEGVERHWGKSFSMKFVTVMGSNKKDIAFEQINFYQNVKSLYQTSLSRRPLIYKIVTSIEKARTYIYRIKNMLWSFPQPIVNQKTFTSSYKKTKITMLGPTNYSGAKPKIYPPQYRKILPLIDNDYFAPEVFATNMGQCFSIGASNLTTNGKLAVLHDALNVSACLTSEEMHHRISIFPESRRLFFNASFKNPKHLRQAANFLDASATNYAHWLTEILPKIVVFAKLGSFSGTPILIDEGLHSNHLEALYSVIGDSYPIVIVPPNDVVLCDNLLSVSVVGYSCFGPRKTHKLPNYPEYQKFNKLAFDIFREIGVTHSKQSNKTFPKNVYLSRGSITRSVENETEIISTLKEHNFSAINVEDLTFADQVKLFKTAKNIVAPTGSVLANMIFSSHLTSIIVLFPYSKIANYGYWVNIAALNRVNISYVIGEPLNAHLEYHSSYRINVSDIVNAF